MRSDAGRVGHHQRASTGLAVETPGDGLARGRASSTRSQCGLLEEESVYRYVGGWDKTSECLNETEIKTYRHRRSRPLTDAGLQAHVFRHVRKKPMGGYRRITGELIGLDYQLGASTIWAMLRRAGIDPNAHRHDRSWLVSLGAQARHRHRV
jgi:hypothetical protein